VRRGVVWSDMQKDEDGVEWWWGGGVLVRVGMCVC
jgi:hypothetical protein